MAGTGKPPKGREFANTFGTCKNHSKKIREEEEAVQLPQNVAAPHYLGQQKGKNSVT